MWDVIKRRMELYSSLVQTVNLYRDPESAEGHLRPVSSIAWNPDGEQ